MNGVLNRELNRAAGKHLSKDMDERKYKTENSTRLDFLYLIISNCLSFLYPYGATLNVQKPAVPLLSSGSVSYPLNRPVAAIYVSPVF